MRTLLLITVLITGCVGAPLTQDERDERADRRAQRADVWRVCRRVYDAAGVPTVHVGHTHDPMWPTTKHQEYENMRDDIRWNNCDRIYRQVMKEKL